MKKELLTILGAMFAVALVLGCTGLGGGQEEESGPEGYTLSVTPKEVVQEGIVTYDLRIQNIFDRDMKNIEIKTQEIEGFGEVSGAITKDDGVDVLPGQTLPVLLTLDVDKNAFGDISGKNVRVCFDYTTGYYYDIGMKLRTQATEELNTAQGYSSGPVAVEMSGLETVFIENGEARGLVTVADNWQGFVKEVSKVTATKPEDISKLSMSIGNCGGEGKTTLKQDDANCEDPFTTRAQLDSGLSVKTELSYSDSIEENQIQRVNGEVDYRYCFDVALPTVIIKSV